MKTFTTDSQIRINNAVLTSKEIEDSYFKDLNLQYKECKTYEEEALGIDYYIKTKGNIFKTANRINNNHFNFRLLRHNKENNYTNKSEILKENNLDFYFIYNKNEEGKTVLNCFNYTVIKQVFNIVLDNMNNICEIYGYDDFYHYYLNNTTASLDFLSTKYYNICLGNFDKKYITPYVQFSKDINFSKHLENLGIEFITTQKQKDGYLFRTFKQVSK